PQPRPLPFERCLSCSTPSGATGSGCAVLFTGELVRPRRRHRRAARRSASGIPGLAWPLALCPRFVDRDGKLLFVHLAAAGNIQFPGLFVEIALRAVLADDLATAGFLRLVPVALRS